MTNPTGLTERQQQVAVFASKGYIKAQIAVALGISTHTVDDHLKAIHRRLGVNNRAELVLETIRLGILKPPR